MISKINFSSNNDENPKPKRESSATENFQSVFDVNKNNKIDKSDFSAADLKNSDINMFFTQNEGKDWSAELSNQIAPLISKTDAENLQKSDKKNHIEIKDNKLVITIKNKKHEISITGDKDLTKDDIQNLFNSVSDLTSDELSDLVNEVKGINLLNDAGVGGTGFFNSNDTVDLSTADDNYGVTKNTLVHEVGHGISLIHKNNAEYNSYSYNKALHKEFGGIDGLDSFMKSLHDKYNTKEYGDGYAASNVNEFFAEYYLYKKEGKTHHGSEKLFKAMESSDSKEEQKFLEILNKSFKFSKKDARKLGE